MRFSKIHYQNPPRQPPWCSLCGREVAPGERGWYRNGTSVCEECFEDFARQELVSFEIVFGEEDINDAL